MKKLIGILLFALFAIGLQAQTVLGRAGTEASPKVLDGSVFGYFWGTSSSGDTLNASDTLTLYTRIKGDAVQDLTMQLYVTKTSGTVTNNFVLYQSMNGTTWTSTGDTIKFSNASTGLNTTIINKDDWAYPYAKLQGISGATAQRATYKLWFVKRDE